MSNKASYQRKCCDQKTSPLTSTKHLKKNLYQFLLNYFTNKIEIHIIFFLNTLHKTSITLKPRPDRDTTTKNIENIRPINFDEYRKLNPKVYDYLSWSKGNQTRMQGWLNICKEKNMIHHIDKTTWTKLHELPMAPEKAFDKIQYHFTIKRLDKLGTQGINLNIIKTVYNNPTANIILNAEKLKAF